MILVRYSNPFISLHNAHGIMEKFKFSCPLTNTPLIGKLESIELERGVL